METSEPEIDSTDNKIEDEYEKIDLKPSAAAGLTSSQLLKQKIDPDLVDLQKVDVFLQQLPYFERIKANAFESFEEIKKNLCESLVLNEIRPGFLHWTNRLIVFIQEFGLFFTKADHIKLIKIYLRVVQTLDLDLSAVDFCFNALTELLK